MTRDTYLRTASSFGGLQVTLGSGGAKPIPVGELSIGPQKQPSSPKKTATRLAHLSNASAARPRVCHPKDGAGFGFGSAKLSRSQLEQFVKANASQLLSPENEIVLIAGASSTGSKAANERLAKQRGAEVANFLRSRLGIDTARIRVEIKLADPSRPERAEDRTVRIRPTPFRAYANT